MPIFSDFSKRPIERQHEHGMVRPFVSAAKFESSSRPTAVLEEEPCDRLGVHCCETPVPNRLHSAHSNAPAKCSHVGMTNLLIDMVNHFVERTNGNHAESLDPNFSNCHVLCFCSHSCLTRQLSTRADTKGKAENYRTLSRYGCRHCVRPRERPYLNSEASCLAFE